MFLLANAALWKPSLMKAALVALALQVTSVAVADQSPPAALDLTQKIEALTSALTALGATVDAAEAQKAATLSYATANELRVEYRMVSPPQLHNILIQLGLRKHGLCCDWAAVMVRRLHALELTTLEVHWIVAHQGNVLREHNSALLTAVGGDLATGIVIDGWRNSGELYWGAARDDRYPWKMHPDNREWQLLECR